MEKPIKLILVIAAVIFLAVFIFLNTRPEPFRVLAYLHDLDGTQTQLDSIRAFQDHAFVLNEMENTGDEARLSWKITNTADQTSTYNVSEGVLTQQFSDTGWYQISAFSNQVLMARDSLYVLAGYRILANLPSSGTVGEELFFTDETPNAKSKIWRITGRRYDERFEGSAMTWIPKKPGLYNISLEVEVTGIDSVLTRSEEINIAKKMELPKPKRDIAVVVEKPREKPRPKPENRPKPAPAKPQPVKNPPAPGNAFLAVGFNNVQMQKLSAKAAAPDREAIVFKEGKTVIELVAKEDCQLSQFKVWGNSNSQLLKIVIKCTNVEQNNIFSSEFSVTNDYQSPIYCRLSKTDKMLAGNTYSITIETLSGGELGFGALQQRQFSNSYADLSFPATSCAFDFQFRY